MTVDQFLLKLRKAKVARLIASEAVGDGREQFELLVTKKGDFFLVHVVHNEIQPFLVQIEKVNQKGARAFWKRRITQKSELDAEFFYADKPYAELGEQALRLIDIEHRAPTWDGLKGEVLAAMKDPKYLEFTKKGFSYTERQMNA